MRQRNRRNFCSRLSPVRLGILTVILVYSIRYWLFPSWFTQLRRQEERRHPFGWWWLPSSSLLDHLSEKSQAIADAKRLQREQNKVTEANKQERYKILERLSPKWFHRNDLQSAASPDTSAHSQEDAKSKMGAADATRNRMVKEDANLGNPDIHLPDDGKQSVVHENARAQAGTTKDSIPYSAPRTLSNMDLFSNQTSCPPQLNPSDISTTLVIQTSLDRSWVLEETCRRWKDPIVAVLALTTAQSKLDSSTIHSEWKSKCPNLNIVIYQMTPDQQDPAMYPVNHLRNLGLDHVQTSHLLVVDVDFVPSDGLADDIRKAIVWRQAIREKNPDAIRAANREAIVIPAFQRNTAEPCLTETECKQFLSNDSSFIPRGFEELRSCMLRKDCTVFQYEDNWEGHHSTKSEQWLAKRWYEEENTPQTDMKDLKRILCFDSLRYEPYVVIRWCPGGNIGPPIVTTPFYDERFHGYGKNKIQYIQHLRFAGYEFAVLPGGFIVHNPHPPSKSKEVWNDRQSHSLHKEMDELYPIFLQELFNKFETSLDEAVGQC